MVKSINEVEKNVSASFGYVKKDMLMLNDAISDVHDKIQHLSMNHAALLAEIQNISKMIAGKKTTSKPKKVKKIKKVKKSKKKRK